MNKESLLIGDTCLGHLMDTGAGLWKPGLVGFWDKP